ncbi:cyclic AMP-dependent transcription factor ATF-6 alpha [Scaptodrosophila lebanonensis]|uniref:Cyclic AMP-dependent transcription factor ATF-6 alpha n=1 Tax=Drosophila lebanonensis TaxID=7225 RepID=A0A6J2UDR6_DROLE|nr:cyclic AMP-dependent transcription factor ATF-6 alpha [Scaptodrosophila lebanonensis]
MDVDDNFYDELSSFMPSPDEYGLNNSDLDDIIGSTVSQLDSSIDLNTFIPPPPPEQLPPQLNTLMYSDLPQPIGQSQLDFDLGFGSLSAFSSPASSSERTPSTSSTEGPDYFDDLMNFLNKSDVLTRDNLLEHMQARNTPSPTGSCSSSSGSSTSGVHSDISDTCSRASSVSQSKLHDQIDIESAAFGSQQTQQATYTPSFEDASLASMLREGSEDMLMQPQPHLMSVITMPVLQQQPSTQPFTVKVEPGMPVPIMPPPVKVVPAPLQVKIENPSPAPEPATATKVVTSATTSTGKPKTIFLSSNDFKALMQKMNSTNAKGVKINGSVNAQMPKIIMKTNNGKIIAANKMVQPMNVTHVNAPKLVNQQTSHPTKLATSSRAAISGTSRPLAATTTHTASSAEPSGVIYRGMIDEKMYKKQQRMIKNRESASLSRKKKKEYVVSLESRINKLEQENYTLKGENVTLRNQLVAFARTCKCRDGNVSEFVLNSLNASVKGEQQHVKIAPKPALKSLKQRMTAATVKKNVAVLFAMAFMVTLNAGNFQSYLKKTNLDGDGAVLESMVEEPMSTGRRLLWVETEEEYNEKLNRSKRQAAAELDVPPLHFLRPANRSANGTSTAASETSFDPPPLASVVPPKCNGSCAATAASGNQSEFSRLAHNLHKWIDGNDYLNLSMHTKFGNELDNPHGFKLTTDYLELKTDMERQSPHPGKRKIYIDYNEKVTGHKQRKMDTTDTKLHEKDDLMPLTHKDNGEKSLKLYKPNIDEEYLRLFKGIKRQDDTFYVLSFNMEHILLPASSYNKSTRPKMSLLLPTGDPTRNGDIVLMQIDCEVFNTTQLELKSHMIPAKLRPNVTKWHPTTPKPTDVANNETQGTAAKSRDKLPLKFEPPKEKPRVRTYFMMGPKNQAAAAASSEQPRLVKFNSTEPTIANQPARNGTLYARMRETVRGEFGP